MGELFCLKFKFNLLKFDKENVRHGMIMSFTICFNFNFRDSVFFGTQFSIYSHFESHMLKVPLTWMKWYLTKDMTKKEKQQIYRWIFWEHRVWVFMEDVVHNERRIKIRIRLIIKLCFAHPTVAITIHIALFPFTTVKILKLEDKKCSKWAPKKMFERTSLVDHCHQVAIVALAPVLR